LVGRRKERIGRHTWRLVGVGRKEKGEKEEKGDGMRKGNQMKRE
jgi:hypothetical protein